MSGYKRATVSISQDEYDRLREAENNLRSLPEISHDTYQEIEGQSYQLLQSNIQDIENRQSQFTQVLANVDESILLLETQTNNHLLAFQQQTLALLNSSVGDLWKAQNSILEQQAQQFSALLNRCQAEQQQEINTLSGQFNQWKHDQEARKVIAENWVYTFEQLVFFVREQYAHDFFFPGKLQRFEMALTQAYHNFEHGLYDAVVSGTQNAYLTLSELRLELEYKQTEWQTLYQAAWEAINLTFAQIERSAFVPALDLDGLELPYFVDVNFWTDGQCDGLLEKVNEIGQLLLDENSTPGIDTLRSWLEVDLPQIQNHLESLVLDARIKTINSQLRINVADLVIQALQNQGFALDMSAYQANDMRLGYGAQLRNVEGNEVIVSVSPNGDHLGENELQVQSIDAEEKTEHELLGRWQEIQTSLTHFGVAVGQVEQQRLPLVGANASHRLGSRKQHSHLLRKTDHKHGN
jgi:hypothetical protein